MATPVINVCFKDQTRPITPQQKVQTFQQLKKRISKWWNLSSDGFQMSYWDCDDDLIWLRCQEEFDYMIKKVPESVKIMIKKNGADENNDKWMDDQQIHNEDEGVGEEKSYSLTGENPLEDNAGQQQDSISQKVQSRDEQITKQQSKVVHQDVTCHLCEKKNIEGVRYKCAVCPDFDFCQECEATEEHPHPFLKIKTLKHFSLIKTQNNDAKNNLLVEKAKQKFANFLMAGKDLFDNLIQIQQGLMRDCNNPCCNRPSKTEQRQARTALQQQKGNINGQKKKKINANVL